MTDLITRLRERREVFSTYSGKGQITLVRGDAGDPLCREAADEIERLRAELQHARDGLTKGRTRMREDIERLRAAAEQARAALRESRHYDRDGAFTDTVIEPAMRALDEALKA